MTISLAAKTVASEEQLAETLSITAYHEVYDDLTTDVTFRIPGSPTFILPAAEAQRLGEWLTTTTADRAAK